MKKPDIGEILLQGHDVELEVLEHTNDGFICRVIGGNWKGMFEDPNSILFEYDELSSAKNELFFIHDPNTEKFDVMTMYWHPLDGHISIESEF